MHRTEPQRAERSRRSLARPRHESPARGARSTDEGFSLVEVIIAISLLGMFAVVFAPVIYHGLSITANQATVAYASQRASTYIDDARAATAPSGTCAALLAATSDVAPVISTDPRGVTVKVSGAVDGCNPVPTAPHAVTLSVTTCVPAAGSAAADPCASGDRRLAVVTTKILVRG